MALVEKNEIESRGQTPIHERHRRSGRRRTTLVIGLTLVAGTHAAHAQSATRTAEGSSQVSSTSDVEGREGAAIEAHFASDELIELDELMHGLAGRERHERFTNEILTLEARLAGRTVLVDGGALSINLPTQSQWETIEHPIGDATSPVVRPVFQTRDVETGLTLMVTAARWPTPMPLEELVASMGTGLEAPSPDEGYAEVNDLRYWERTGTLSSNVSVIQRLLVYDERSMVHLVVLLPTDAGSSTASARAAALLETVRLGLPVVAPHNAFTTSRGRVSLLGQPFQVGGPVTEPVQLHAPPPIYPRRASRAKIRGTVVVRAIVRKDGTVADEFEVQESPSTLLSEATLEAVRTWRFQPAVLDGEPVDVYFDLTVHFLPQVDARRGCVERTKF